MSLNLGNTIYSVVYASSISIQPTHSSLLWKMNKSVALIYNEGLHPQLSDVSCTIEKVGHFQILIIIKTKALSQVIHVFQYGSLVTMSLQVVSLR